MPAKKIMLAVASMFRVKESWMALDTSGPIPGKSPTMVPTTTAITIAEQVSYLDDAAPQHRMDIARPLVYEGKLPVIVQIHGGGWVYGHKDTYYKYYGMELSRRGYGVLTINYRLGFDAPFPAQLEDCVAALKWIEEHGDEYDLDVIQARFDGRIARAQLSALTAHPLLSQELSDKFILNRPKVVIQGLGLSCGVYDLVRLLNAKLDYPNRVMTAQTLFDREDFMNHPLFPYSSVSNNLHPDFPPSYLLTTQNDDLIVETMQFDKELREMGIKHKLRVMAKKEKLYHVFNIKLIYPQSLDVMDEMIRFFKNNK